MKRLFFTILFLLVLAGPGWATDYYVSKSTGDDANAGTELAPFEHIPVDANATGNASTAGSSISGGDIIYLARGDVFQDVDITITVDGSDGSPITIDAYGTGNDPVISAQTYYSSGWTEESGEYYQGGITTDPGQVFDGDTRLTEGTKGSLSNGEYAYDDPNNRVYVKLAAGNPDGGNINCATRLRSIFLNNADWWDIKNCVLEGSNSTINGTLYVNDSSNCNFTNLTIKKHLRYAIRTQDINQNNTYNGLTLPASPGAGISTDYDIYLYGTPSGSVFQNCILNVKSMLIREGGGAIFDNNTIISTDTAVVMQNGAFTFTNNTLTGPGNTDVGIDLNSPGSACTLTGNTYSEYNIAISSDDSDHTITNETIFDCNSKGIYIIAGSPTISDCIISNVYNGLDYIAGGNGIGIHIETTGGSPTIQRCDINLCYCGIRSETTSSINLYYNVVRNSLVNGIECESVTPNVANLYNNTIYHNSDPEVIAQGGHGIVIRDLTTTVVRKADLKNNIVYVYNRCGANIDGIQVDANGVAGSHEVTFENNIYAVSGPEGICTLLLYEDTDYTDNFSGWETATGDSNSQIIDPKVNSSGKLLAGSPCIGAGKPITGIHDQATLPTDAAGNEVVWGPSIGAYEWFATHDVYVDASSNGVGLQSDPATFGDYAGPLGATAEADALTFYIQGDLGDIDLSGLDGPANPYYEIKIWTGNEASLGGVTHKGTNGSVILWETPRFMRPVIMNDPVRRR